MTSKRGVVIRPNEKGGNQSALASGVDSRSGYEQTEQGKDLVVWPNKIIDLNAVDEHRVEVTIPAHP